MVCVKLPEEYIVQKFYQYTGSPRHNSFVRTYQGSCALCREGKSWGRKRRCYYIVKKDLIYCHNCGWSGNSIKWIQEVSGLSFKEISEEVRDYEILPLEDTKAVVKSSATLPQDCINILDRKQISFYDQDEIVCHITSFIKKRNLFSARYRPKTLWVSLVDYTHKNRLIIPFYNEDGQIVFYQSRSVFSSQTPKYLSKRNSQASLFNLDNVDCDLDKLFIFEGPIDACFVKNGISITGIQENSNKCFSGKQEEQLLRYKLLDKIWVLDSQWQDSASNKKTHRLIDQDNTVFIWPEKYGRQFKDFNEMAVGLGINEIPYTFILDNSYTGLKGRLNMAQIPEP